MGSCTTVSWTFQDLENQRASQKQKEIHEFDTRNLVSGLNTREPQTCTCTALNYSEERKICLRELANVKKQYLDLTDGIEALRREKVTVTETRDETLSLLDSSENVVEQMKLNRAKEIEEFKENSAKSIQELENRIDQVEQSFRKDNTEINEVNKRLDQDIETLKFQKSRRYNLSYIWLVCLNLLANMYCYVLPDQFTEDFSFTINDLKEDIEDEDLLSDKEREDASKRWEDLKKELGWNPSLEKTLEMLEPKEGNSLCRSDLTIHEAKRVAHELNEQGCLRGRISLQKVQKIIEMWEISTTLVESST